MKTLKSKWSTQKIANILIVALVLLGTALFVVLMNGAKEGELMSKLFLVFLGAIITLQVIPGLILLGSMLKGLVSLGRKEKATAEGNRAPTKHE